MVDVYTPQIADACLRLEIPLRVAPPGIRPVLPNARISGPAIPVRHYGSVDVFLEVMSVAAKPGAVLVIDNGGRLDEGCIGDLMVVEALHFQLAGLVVWGAHRDTPELEQLDLPVWSYGTTPAGPVRLERREPDALKSARFPGFEVTKDDVVFADRDGVVFAPAARLADVERIAREVARVEARERERVLQGASLGELLKLSEYLARRATEPAYTFRRHVRQVRGAIEE
jgi:regulator of RNase E activity RraA